MRRTTSLEHYRVGGRLGLVWGESWQYLATDHTTKTLLSAGFLVARMLPSVHESRDRHQRLHRGSVE